MVHLHFLRNYTFALHKKRKNKYQLSQMDPRDVLPHSTVV